MNLDFTENRPAVGTVVMLDDQSFRLTGFEPYVRRDGSPSELMIWEAACAECGTPIKVKSPLKNNGLTRRCVEHSKAGTRVTGGRRVTVRVIPA
ncbi:MULTISPECIES: hypothetical protein [unclassified Novosphingobium]|uniref:hypothetical protein n=1 Tax=unclassified Novosphingobium TaxID=2644732 RepID=UPI001356974E|nr:MULTISPECIES: hypothetical protein [unclassified Novosphingobium]